MSLVAAYHKFNYYTQRQKKKLAYLQLTGKLEGYLTNEFVWHMNKEEKGTRKPYILTNFGKEGEHKVDIVQLKGKDPNQREGLTIDTLVEVKYLRNIHRGMTKSNATDEITTTLKGLKSQAGVFPKNGKHAGFKVNLRSKNRNIYGLVFISFVSDRKNDEQRKKKYFDKVSKAAKKYKFSYYDMKHLQMDDVYNDVKVGVLEAKRYCTLKVGLWRRAGKSNVKRR